MKIYFVRIIKSHDSGPEVHGPSKVLQDMLCFSPREDDKDQRFQICECVRENATPKPIYEWCWKKVGWVPSRVKLSINFGATAPPLAEQLADFNFEENEITHWQKDFNAITRLSVRGLLSDAETDKARNRLLNAITKKK
jgi:hypothetical protein